MAVHPAHRMRGIGSLLMAIGVQQADQMDVECWLESSGMGKPLYEKFGFQSLLKLAFDSEKPDASDEWRKCAHELTPPPVFAMWRPKITATLPTGGSKSVRFPWSIGVE